MKTRFRYNICNMQFYLVADFPATVLCPLRTPHSAQSPHI